MRRTSVPKKSTGLLVTGLFTPRVASVILSGCGSRLSLSYGERFDLLLPLVCERELGFTPAPLNYYTGPLKIGHIYVSGCIEFSQQLRWLTTIESWGAL